MRKQIAAANWKMNLTHQQAEQLLNDVLSVKVQLTSDQRVLFGVPYPFIPMALEKIASFENYDIAAQNCHHKTSGAYTGEVSVDMLYSIGIRHCIVGHSERREYFRESNKELAEKLDLLLIENITPIFCCGESLSVRKTNTQDEFVETQLKESLFHLSPEQVVKVVIAYEPIWAIGTGETASTKQAQAMHAHLREVLGRKYGNDIADEVSILYGGSVKAANAKELFACPDVDGGLVGGASLQAQEFIQIIKALKS